VSENEVYPPNGNFHWEEEVTPVDLGVRGDYSIFQRNLHSIQ